MSDILNFDKVFISKKRSIYIKLRVFDSSQYGKSRFIEIQEVRRENGNKEYGEPLRLPTSEKTLLLAEIIKNFAMQGRERRLQQKNGNSTNASYGSTSQQETQDANEKQLSKEELAVLIFEHFKGQQCIKSNINSFLKKNNFAGDVNGALQSLLEKNKVNYEERTSKAGNKYQLWTFLE